MVSSNLIKQCMIFGFSIFFTNTPSDLAEHQCSEENSLGNAAFECSLKQFFIRPYLLNYLLTPWCRVLLEKLTGLQLVKKFPAFHGTRRFITALTSFSHLSILGQPNPVHIPTSHLLKIHPNIIHPSTPRSLQWSLSLRFPHQDPIHPLSSPIRATCPTHLILLDFITHTILGEE